MNKSVPQLYTAKGDCCGCTACYCICPVNAIDMKPDEEGFLYPIVNDIKCVCCYRCLSVCPLKVMENENE
ncbi:putative iron-sulfur cluster-binding protein/coenzyme F420-reducing hydrogenase, beta subunit [Clostridium sp. D5]|nr:putative iron-sulfur cluster-binding protein/coenzyme F420-reducing hydrogenase, beta subunit [Clostridium sp. D5]